MIRSAMRRPDAWLLASIVALAALIRFRALSFGLPFTQARPDETFIIEAARTILSGHLPPFFDYPWLYIWLVTIGDLGYYVWGGVTGSFHSVADMVASWPTHWDPFFLIPRALSATSGTLSVLVVYRLGRQLRDEATGLVSALFLAVAFMHARDSHFGTTDVLMTLFIVAAVSLLLDADRTQQPRHYAWAGCLAGLAAATKYNAVILLAPMAIVYSLRLTDRRLTRRQALIDNRLVYLLLPFIVAFGIGIPFVVIDRERFMLAMGELMKSMREGDRNLLLQNGWLHHLQFSLRYGLGLPLLIASFAGIPLLLRLRPRAGLIALSFPVAYYIVAGSIRNLFFRYMIPAVPFLCVTAAFFICWTASALAARLAALDPPRQQSTRRATTAALALLLALPSAIDVRELDRILAAADNRTVTAQWVEQHVPAGSSLIQSGSRLGYARFGVQRYREWKWDGGRNAFMFDGVRAVGNPDWILMQDSPLPSSTQDVVKRYLREGYTQVAEFKASPLDPDTVYDRQDGFFIPFNGLDRIERPGPNFTIYRRNDPTASASDGSKSRP